MKERFKTNWKRIHWPKLAAWYLLAFLLGSAVYSLAGALVLVAALTVMSLLTILFEK